MTMLDILLRAVPGRAVLAVVLAVCAALSSVQAADAAAARTAPSAAPAHDPALARFLGADERGMRSYVLVILKTGPTRVPAGPERDAMFTGHFANMSRLSDAGVLVLAGPLDGVDGWRGLFVLAVPDIETAKTHVATDPVIVQGEMVAEYHGYYGTAALMAVRDIHAKLARPAP